MSGLTVFTSSVITFRTNSIHSSSSGASARDARRMAAAAGTGATHRSGRDLSPAELATEAELVDRTSAEHMTAAPVLFRQPGGPSHLTIHRAHLRLGYGSLRLLSPTRWGRNRSRRMSSARSGKDGSRDVGRKEGPQRCHVGTGTRSANADTNGRTRGGPRRE